MLKNTGNNKINSKILIMTSVEAEQNAIREGLGLNNERFTLALAGVGPMSAAANTATMLANSDFSLVINMGIAGGFPESASIGDVVIALKMVAADLGAESENGFKPIEELGFGKSVYTVTPDLVDKVNAAIQIDSLISVHTKTILTLSTVTGTTKSLEELQQRFPEAGAEAMEGFGVATAAELKGVPCMEIRSISNLIGPRDREAWRIKDALESLKVVSSILKEVL
ncbi:futalosine hydrolase [Salipaludibacillus neizhouensis]|uniref:Futalosine hydrolase n=2 Tax=Salipaludibacillus neizhouensis TaxID=885475 RepID=A0A3A9K9Z0_9BACI|nr:futalosine hydrolase [Salipaludibacillus neizhouensis]